MNNNNINNTYDNEMNMNNMENIDDNNNKHVEINMQLNPMTVENISLKEKAKSWLLVKGLAP